VVKSLAAGARTETCLCQEAMLEGCSGACDRRPWRGGVFGRSVLFGFGSGCSEVPVFRVQPATLDSESSLVALPSPACSAVGVGA
jgi:hypothetical protein